MLAGELNPFPLEKHPLSHLLCLKIMLGLDFIFSLVEQEGLRNVQEFEWVTLGGLDLLMVSLANRITTLSL